jgi:hypothetical protein
MKPINPDPSNSQVEGSGTGVAVVKFVKITDVGV